MSCTVDSSSDDEDEYLVVVRHNNAGATVPTPPVEQLAAADRNAVVQDQFDPLDDVVPQDETEQEHLSDVEPDLEGDFVEGVDTQENEPNPDIDEQVEPVVSSSDELEGGNDTMSDTGDERSILEDTVEAEPNETTDESWYESTAETLPTDADDSDEYDPDGDSPTPNRPGVASRRTTRTIKPPPIYTYNKLGGEPSLCHNAARSFQKK